jgi:hypothetical protein
MGAHSVAPHFYLDRNYFEYKFTTTASFAIPDAKKFLCLYLFFIIWQIHAE